MSKVYRTSKGLEYVEIATEIVSFNLFDERVCLNLIKKAELNESWENSRLSTDKSISEDSLKMRDSEQLWLKFDEKLSKLYDKWVSSLIPGLVKSFWDYNIDGRTEAYIVRYGPGQFYSEHIDAGLTEPRLVSMVCYLNDDFTGGETAFPRQNIKVKPETGRAILFPSGISHKHAACDVTEGFKYALVGWFY